jgi:1-acyl-sn-glycerol-3-phosphate acyltransferase
VSRPEPPRIYRRIVAVCRPLMRAMTSPRRWRGSEHLPDGPFVVVANHISVFDPFTLLHFLVDHDVYPSVLVKASLWRYPVIGSLLTRVGAVPVHRGSADASGALVAAQTALSQGFAVMLYPEGTTTLDPQEWPMRAKTGAARLALLTGAPVIPVALWGAQRVIPSRGRVGFWPIPRKPVDVVAGPPVDLDDLRERADDPAAWVEATDRMMDRITGQLAQVRGETPPAERFVREPHVDRPRRRLLSRRR